MLTYEEGQTVKSIKQRVLAGDKVSRDEQAYVVRLLVREQLPITSKVATRIANSGFNTTGLIVK